ncbi:MAG: flagellar biosynthesis repressor FlbT [Alphaproteobacteria bacterium]|nr:flagellar biosynthesis repressor FlbT [Alphaproteobacteria bacterium]
MPLKLVLKPGERVVLNQAVIVNGRQKTEFILENKASVLRERDIMTEEKADTPAKKVYFVVQMMYLFPENMQFYQEKFNVLVRDFLQAVPSATPIVSDIGDGVIKGDLYNALKQCRKLMKYEGEVLENVTEPN